MIVVITLDEVEDLVQLVPYIDPDNPVDIDDSNVLLTKATALLNAYLQRQPLAYTMPIEIKSVVRRVHKAIVKQFGSTLIAQYAVIDHQGSLIITFGAHYVDFARHRKADVVQCLPQRDIGVGVSERPAIGDP